MFYIKNSMLVALFILLCSCQPNGQQDNAEGPMAKENPPSPGFDKEGSDSLAIVIANQVMNAMGGRASWNSTRYIGWNFFGARHLLWDKKTGNVRIKSLNDDLEIIVNINSMEGKVSKDGTKLTNADSLTKYLEQGRNIWRNDSYWLVMPFKLKDSGVTLTYVGEDATKAGEKADVLELRFSKVGHTPENKYHVWVDKDDHLVKQFAYYKNASQDAANFILPWQNYKQYGTILLSGDRGERQLTDIKVYDEVPENIFTSFKVELPN